MIKRIDDIRDDELRIIGQSSENMSSFAEPTTETKTKVCSKEEEAKEKKKSKWIRILIIGLPLVTMVVLATLLFRKPPEPPVDDVFDQSTSVQYEAESPEPPVPLGDYSETSKAYTEHLQRTINDIPLDIYIPHNATPILALGTPDINDKSIVFVTQAADIRADNGKINGAFVLAGQPLAWGLSKKGYVSIIDGKITVGVADNSPLFEEATEKEGYFFRQYPLVDNGQLVENEPKGKAIRKAICERNGEIIIVFSSAPESFHDFAQALVDLQVNNAVYLVGSEYSYGFYRDKENQFTQFAEKRRGGQKFENYIIWR